MYAASVGDGSYFVVQQNLIRPNGTANCCRMATKPGMNGLQPVANTQSVVKDLRNVNLDRPYLRKIPEPYQRKHQDPVIPPKLCSRDGSGDQS